jgi:hypothetical protein
MLPKQLRFHTINLYNILIKGVQNTTSMNNKLLTCYLIHKDSVLGDCSSESDHSELGCGQALLDSQEVVEQPSSSFLALTSLPKGT